MSLKVFLSFCFSSSKDNTILLPKYLCVEFSSIKLSWDNKSENRKNKKYPSVQKSYSTSRQGIGGQKKKENISESETTTLKYFYNLKKNQQDQGDKK